MKRKNKITDQNITELFESFWNNYDKKVGKFPAFKAFIKLSIEEMLQAVEMSPRYVSATPDKKYRCHPSTYLNQKRFLDDIDDLKGSNDQKTDPFKSIMNEKLNDYGKSKNQLRGARSDPSENILLTLFDLNS